jgi:hypothetical protein
LQILYERGHAVRFARETGFDEVRAAVMQRRSQAGDQIPMQSAQIAVEIDQQIVPRGVQPVAHRSPLPEQSAGDDARAGRLGEFGSAVNRTVINDDDIAEPNSFL